MELFLFVHVVEVCPQRIRGKDGFPSAASKDGSVTVLAKFSNSSWDLLSAHCWLANQQWLEDMRAINGGKPSMVDENILISYGKPVNGL